MKSERMPVPQSGDPAHSAVRRRADTTPMVVRIRTTARWCLAGALLGVALTAFAPVGGAASSPLDCTFRSVQYPKLNPTARPGSLYAVFIRRQLTCDEARTVARRGTKTSNPGKLKTFALPGGWRCVSLAPLEPGNGKVLAGQCLKAPGKIVNWVPVCAPRTPCTNLRGRT